MALAIGIFLPVAETIRRINQIIALENFFSWFDDYILGGLIVAAAYLVLKDARNARTYLIVAWTIACLALAASFMGELNYYESASGDPGIFSTTFVLVAKGLILIYMIVGLTLAIKSRHPQ